MTLTPTHQILDNGLRLNFLYPRLATVTRRDGERQWTYIGFDNSDEAKALLKELRQHHRAILRRAKRLKTLYEIKVWGLSTEEIFTILKDLYASQTDKILRI